MFCCKPRLTGDEEEQMVGKGETTLKQGPRVSTDGWEVITFHENAHQKVDPGKHYKTLDKNFKMARHRVDHVRTVQDNLYERLAGGTLPKQHVMPEKGRVLYYTGDRHYKMAAAPKPATNVNISRSVSQNYKGVSIPRARLQVNRSYSQRETPAQTVYRVSAQIVRPGNVENMNWEYNNKEYRTDRDVVEYQNPVSKIPKPSVDSGVHEESDSGSFTEEQKSALDQLDDTLNEYNTGVFDEVTPVIVTGVLPFGVFEVDEKFDSGLESDETPSSRTSSLSSNKSLNAKGIISNSKSKRDRRMPSVSFNLPPDHVDKPYAPLQWNRTRSAPPAPMITITDYKSKVWHSGGDKTFVEDKLARRSSGPFKGSFKKIFYGKYAPKEVTNNDQGKLFVSPMLLERVSSFETLSDEIRMQEQLQGASRGKVIVR